MLHKVLFDQNAARTEHSVNFPQSFLRLKVDIQGVGDQHRVKSVVHIGQLRCARTLKAELSRTVALFA